MEFDKHNNLVIVSNQGLLFYKPGSGSDPGVWESSWLSYLYPELNSIFTGKDGKIWIGTAEGIITYNPIIFNISERTDCVSVCKEPVL